MKVKKILILSLIIVVIIIIIILLLLMKNANNFANENKRAPNEYIEIKNNIIEEVNDNNTFFAIQNCIQSYYDIKNKKNNIYIDLEADEKAEDIMYSNLKIMLSESYWNEHNLFSDNIFDTIDITNEKHYFISIQEKHVEFNNCEKYLVYGIDIDEEYSFIRKAYYIINVDKRSTAFSIEPVNVQEINSIDDIKYNSDEIEIKIDDSYLNSFNRVNFKDEELCNLYFINYRKLMIAYPEEAYKFLDDNYAMKRFGNVSIFKEYARFNKDYILKAYMDSYRITRGTDGINIVISDQYSNKYLFKISAAMNFKVELDSYTLEQEELAKAYAEYTETEKAAYNASVWIQMLNTRDYEAAYNKLNIAFRENTWENIQEFAREIYRNYNSCYEISSVSADKSGDYYIVDLVLKDHENKNTIKQLKINMLLKEDMDFEMSFVR